LKEYQGHANKKHWKKGSFIPYADYARIWQHHMLTNYFFPVTVFMPMQSAAAILTEPIVSFQPCSREMSHNIFKYREQLE
jgi:hypothetical protein